MLITKNLEIHLTSIRQTVKNKVGSYHIASLSYNPFAPKSQMLRKM